MRGEWRKMKHKKKTSGGLVLLACLCLLLFLGACGNDKKETAADPDELSVAVWGYDANPEFKAMVKGFEEENPGKKIKIIDIDADNYENKVTIMLSGKEAADVVGIKTVGSYVNYANRGQLADLTDLYKTVKNPENLEKNISGYDLDDHYYALPFRREIFVLYYNKGMFAEEGQTMPEGLTWEQYEELAKNLTHKKDGEDIYGAYHENFYAPAVCSIASQSGKDLLEPKYDYLKDNLERFIRMQKDGSAMSYSSIKSISASYSSQFETGKAAMLPMGSFYIGKLIKATQDKTTDVDWGVAPMPQMDSARNDTFGSCTGFAVTKASKKQKLAKKFTAYCAGEKGAEKVASVGMIPAYQSKEAMDIYYALPGVPKDALAQKALSPEQNNPEIPPSKYAAQIDDIFTEEYDLMMVGEESPAKFIDTVTKRVKELMAEDK